MRSCRVVIAWAAILVVVPWMVACRTPAPVPQTPLPLVWQAQVTNLISRPTASDDLIVFVDEYGKLVALDAESGEKRWQANLSLASPGDLPVAMEGGRIFAAVNGEVGKVLALDAETGSRQWHTSFGPYYDDDHPIPHQGVVYFEVTDRNTHSARLRAAEAATGEVLWEVPIGSRIATVPKLGSDLIYVGAYTYGDSSIKTRTVRAIDTASGQSRWTYESDLDLSKHFALDDEYLYFGVDAGFVIARRAITGEPAWTKRVGDLLSNSPSVANGLVYIGTKEGQLMALSATDGTEQWALDVGSPILTQTVFADGVIYFGTNEGYLYAVDALTGEEKWNVQSPVRKSIGVADYVPAMGTTPVVAGDLLLYFNGHTLNALKLK